MIKKKIEIFFLVTFRPLSNFGLTFHFSEINIYIFFKYNNKQLQFLSLQIQQYFIIYFVIVTIVTFWHCF